ncbi:IS605 OrfB family transposase [Halanaerobium saccharolyticum]|uniref:IS605 OrfB family transposase n=3 Tax=Halanaerobium saccharolyticum TaxID=43595 RepID=A0A2T5RF55_9FIRM|nr:IS200/IS605 family accessory protein TnpB-related protein [Halanaerobium saccharolyticum]PTV92953.1 IS605 OrfB family transposase [Halanaerobium saccharolyticum]
MKLSFKFKPAINHKNLNIIRTLSFHTSKLYNIVNYSINEEKNKPVYTKLDEQFRDNWHCDFLHSHNRQQCLKLLAQNWKSYFRSLNDYKKNPSKYKGTPKSPKYKYLDSNPNEIIFTNYAIRIKNGNLLLSLSKKMKSMYKVDNLKFELSDKVQSFINMDSIQQIKIKRESVSNRWYLIVIYNKECKNNDGSNIMSIDPGLDNLAAITFKDSDKNYLINGKPLRIDRRNYVLNYLHKASRQVIDIALNENVGTIVIGDIKNIKQNSTIKSFVQIPVQRLVNMIEYKAKLEGISFIKINESYTSGCSAVDLEEINKSNYNKSLRVYRGLFKNKKTTINSDINGSLNILRKYLKDKCIPELIHGARDNGVVNPPKRISVAKQVET